MPRSSWEGFLKINLVSIPVKAFTAHATAGGRIGFNQIHASCHSRIRHQKVCPVHGEVSNDEIVPGFEYRKGEYVLLDKKELQQLRLDNDKAIHLDVFVSSEQMMPLYFSGRTYYLAPDGKLAQKSYAVFHKAMSEQGRYAVGEMVFGGKEQLIVVWPVKNLLAMSLLHYEDEIKKPEEFEDLAPAAKAVAPKELHLAEILIDAATVEDFDLGRYRDDYTGRVRKLIEAKAAGKELQPVREEEEPKVINLMDALRKSLETRGKKAPGKKPPKKTAKRTMRRKTG